MGLTAVSIVEPPATKASNPNKLANERFRAEARKLFAHLHTIDFHSLIRPLRPDFTGDVSIEIPIRVRGSLRGGCNVHLPVRWSNGKTWLIRIKLHCVVAFGMIPFEVRRLVLESERATMVALREMGLAVPAVYSPVIVTEGIEFIVVERLQGEPCSRPIVGDQLELVVPHLAAFLIKLSETTFHAIGSLYRAESLSASGSESSVTDAVVVGPSASFKFFRIDDGMSDPFLGPHTTSGERYLVQIELVLDKVGRGDRSLGHPAVVYLVHLWLADIVRSCPRLWDKEEIMLRHADDRGDHLFLDSTGHDLIGVIDWEWAITATKSEAFCAPVGLIDRAAFANGSNELSRGETLLAKAFEDEGRPDLAECVRRGKVHQRLRDMIGSKPLVGMLHGLAAAAAVTSVECTPDSATDLAAWCEETMAKGEYRSDPTLLRLVDDGMPSWRERCAVKPQFHWAV